MRRVQGVEMRRRHIILLLMLVLVMVLVLMLLLLLRADELLHLIQERALGPHVPRFIVQHSLGRKARA